MTQTMPVAAARHYAAGGAIETMECATQIHIEPVEEYLVTISLCAGHDNARGIDDDLGYEIDLTPAAALAFAHQLEMAARDKFRGVIW